MSNEDEIPELIGQLEGTLRAPDPAAIHAGLGARQAVRRRVVGAAGACVAVLAVAGGVLALSGDDLTETTTAASVGDDVDELIFEFDGDAVADDSAPPITTTSVAEPRPPAPGPDAVLAIEADIDGTPGDEQIWLDPDGTLHAGELVGHADYWDVDQYWFGEQALVDVVIFDEQTTAVVLTLPVAEEEDPPNVVQVFLIREQGLRRVFEQTLGVYGVHPLNFDGDGTVSYVEDGWTACRDADPSDVVVRQRIILTADGDDGELIQTSTEDSDETQACNQLAG